MILKPLYPSLYGWQVTYQLPDGSAAFCSCFYEALKHYFTDSGNGGAEAPREQSIKNKLSRFVKQANPIALKAFFPGIIITGDEPRIIDGKEFFFGNRIAKMPELSEQLWDSPEKVFRFEEKICEVCIERVPRHFYCHQMYGSPFTQVYGAWVRAELIRQGNGNWLNTADRSKRTKLWNEAENKVREIVGVPKIGERFISETILFKTVAYLLKDHEVIHHYRAEWLGRQELDIFVPSLNLAIEYQGEQHFVPIEAWGGEDALEKILLRDEEKLRRCERNAVKLIYFDHSMELTEKFVARELRKVITLHEDA